MGLKALFNFGLEQIISVSKYSYDGKQASYIVSKLSTWQGHTRCNQRNSLLQIEQTSPPHLAFEISGGGKV